MKKISVVIPCYNDNKSIELMHGRLSRIFREELGNYEYEIIFVDDCSPDNTWEKITEICQKDSKVKGVHNITNFGPARNIYQSVKYSTGDAAFLLMGDLQQPPEKLPEFIKYWNEGHTVVIGVHPNTEAKGVMALGRKLYYMFMMKFSNDKIIPNFNCFGLYDKSFVDTLNLIEDTQPYFTGVVAEYGGNIKVIQVKQKESIRGRSNQRFFKKYDYAMIGFTSYTKIMLRVATLVGVFVGAASFIFSIIVLILKLIHWDSYPMGTPSLLIGIFFLGAVQLFFLGIMGEYVLSINDRSVTKPLTVVDKKVNFDEEDNVG